MTTLEASIRGTNRFSAIHTEEVWVKHTCPLVLRLATQVVNYFPLVRTKCPVLVLREASSPQSYVSVLA